MSDAVVDWYSFFKFSFPIIKSLTPDKITERLSADEILECELYCEGSCGLIIYFS